jgi:hypothetical protein
MYPQIIHMTDLVVCENNLYEYVPFVEKDREGIMKIKGKVLKNI